MTSIHIGVVMGSSSDWDTMQHAVEILQHFGIAHEARVVSAHRMPDDLFAYAESAAGRGLKAIIAGAGGAAHLPGMLAAKTPVPVLGVPVASRHLQGVDSLYSIVQMPKGIPVATFAIGTAGAANAALFAVALLANENPELRMIGTRHGEKLYESLLGREERQKAEDSGDYYTVPLDARSLEYEPFFDEGETVVEEEDYHSHHAARLDVDGVKRLLLTLPEIRREMTAAGFNPESAL